VFSNQPPKRVPFGCSMGQAMLLPASLRMPIPHGVVRLLLNTSDNQFGPAADYDGDGKVELLVTSGSLMLQSS